MREAFAGTQPRAQLLADLRYLLEETAAKRTLLDRSEALRGIRAMQASMHVDFAALLDAFDRLIANASRVPDASTTAIPRDSLTAQCASGMHPVIRTAAAATAAWPSTNRPEVTGRGGPPGQCARLAAPPGKRRPTDALPDHRRRRKAALRGKRRRLADRVRA